MYRTSAERRHNDIVKALRKRNICRNYYGWEYYDNLHQYSKNKIHCSCPMCSTKVRKNKDIYGERKGRHGGLNLSHADMKVWEAMTYSEQEYEETAA